MTSQLWLRRSISLNLLLFFVLFAVPLIIFVLADGTNEKYISAQTNALVLALSCVVGLALWASRGKLPLLNVFLVIYTLFWHVRFLTLVLFPDYELVLSRTVVVNAGSFQPYTIAVLVGVAFAIGGIFAGHFVVPKAFTPNTLRREEIGARIESRMKTVWIYLLTALGFQIFIMQYGAEGLPRLISYASLFFQMEFVLFVSTMVLVTLEVTKRMKFCALLYITVYILVLAVGGSRSTILVVVLYVCFIYFINDVSIQFTLKSLIVGAALSMLLMATFVFGTLQRNVRDANGMSLNIESMKYVLGRIDLLNSYDEFKPYLGLAAARAGYLDFSAEIFENPNYDRVINYSNLVASIVNNYTPGPNKIFDDGRRVSYRIRDIYSPDWIGYQSDAIGAIGENFRLFGYAFPLAVFFVALLFSVFFNLASPTVYGFLFKFILSINFMAWWNSFGYDWLLIDIGRHLVFGTIVIWFVFRPSSKHGN